MKGIIKFFKKILVIIIIIILVIVAKVVWTGYNMYENAIAKTSITSKVMQIKNNSSYIDLNEVPKDYQNAVIAVEDHRFMQHNGVDYISTIRAMFKNIVDRKLSEGGSTITQQLAKNMYFTQEKKFERKVAELFVALDLEENYSKDDILELYINISYYGNGYYGLKEATEGYLYKIPKEMTLYESTLLAGLPNAPSIYALNSNPDLAKERQKQVLDSMVKYSYLTEEEAEEVINNN